ncbi:acyl-CoA dehydrogenase family protein, partial [Bacillus cereus group sp. TH253LC]|uniref:acyl-CoA dehydrogenase family protein n=1 Tax=Bacillus cereus group sp. TH253LC TaxID=3018043 RepID=UPI0022E186A4
AGMKGISLFLLPRRLDDGSANHYRIVRLKHKLGTRSMASGEIVLDGAVAYLVGEQGRGFVQMADMVNNSRLSNGVRSAGLMRRAVAEAEYVARERRAFGQAIADMQNTRFKLAEVATTLTVGRAFIDRCVEQLVAGTLDTATASMAKLWGSEAQGRVLDELVQLHGGYGYMNEYMVTRMYADARVQRIYGGTSEIMKEVIARAL